MKILKFLNKRISIPVNFKQVVIQILIIFFLNFATLFYFLADGGHGALHEVIYAIAFGVPAVFFGYFAKRWWLVFLGEIVIFAVFVLSSIVNPSAPVNWLSSFAQTLVPVISMEAMAFAGSLGKKVN